MPQLKVDIGNRTFGGLEEAIAAIIHDQQSSTPTLPQSFLTFVDDTGKTMPITDIGVAYIALAYLGRVDDIRQLERESGISARGIKHEAGMLAAMNGYKTIVEDSLGAMNQSVEPLVGLELLMRDMQTIETLTGFKPTQSMHDAIYSAMAGWKSYADVFKGVATYFNASNSAPPHDTAQKLYERLCTRDIDSSLNRVIQISELFGIPPQIDGQDALPHDFVVHEVKKNYKFGIKNENRIELDKLAMYDEPEFIRRMEEKAGQLEMLGLNGLSIDNPFYSSMLTFYDVVLKRNIPMPRKVTDEMPRNLALSLVNSIDLREFIDMGIFLGRFERFVSSRIYAPDQEIITAAVEGAFEILYGKVRKQSELDLLRWGYQHEVQMRIKALENLSEIANASLSTRSLGYIHDIQRIANLTSQ